MAFKTWQIGLHIQQHEALVSPLFAAHRAGPCNVGGDCR